MGMRLKNVGVVGWVNPGGGGGMSHWGLYIIRVNKNA